MPRGFAARARSSHGTDDASFALIFMAGDERDERAVLAMGERNSRERRNRNRRGDARHHLELDARRGERFGLFAAAPEDERVAALEPHHSSFRCARARSASR